MPKYIEKTRRQDYLPDVKQATVASKSYSQDCRTRVMSFLLRLGTTSRTKSICKEKGKSTWVYSKVTSNGKRIKRNILTFALILLALDDERSARTRPLGV